MKRLELTEEHRSKLLEMCKVLFPKLKLSQQFNLSDEWLEDKIWFQPNKDFIGIHWFEFCMTHLVDKLAWKNIKTDILADCEYEEARLKYIIELAKDRTEGQYHPVDYLYSQWQKLKS